MAFFFFCCNGIAIKLESYANYWINIQMNAIKRKHVFCTELVVIFEWLFDMYKVDN